MNVMGGYFALVKPKLPNFVLSLSVDSYILLENCYPILILLSAVRILIRKKRKKNGFQLRNVSVINGIEGICGKGSCVFLQSVIILFFPVSNTFPSCFLSHFVPIQP